MATYGTLKTGVITTGASQDLTIKVNESGTTAIVVDSAGATSFNDNNITNVGDISLDSISSDGGTITVGDGADLIVVNPTAGVSFSDKNITNVGDIKLDSITHDGATIVIGDSADPEIRLTNGVGIGVTLGNTAGDDFTIDSTAFVVEGDTGNVGIGTSSPAYLIHTKALSSDNFIAIENTGNTNYSGLFFIRETTSGVGKGGAYIRLQSDTSGTPATLELGTGSNILPDTAATRMAIDSSGNVGIGTSSPSADHSESAYLQIGDSSDTISGWSIEEDNNKWDFISNGDFLTYDGATARTKISSSTGDFYTNDGTVSSLSDVRTKRDINNLGDGLVDLMKLRPVSFKYNGKSDIACDDDKTRFGFIADEILEILPQYVEIGEGDIGGEEVKDYKSISMMRMFPMVVKAIQEQQTIIEKLTARLEALEAK